MLIPEVPDTIPRAKVVEFFKSLGIDPAWCTAIGLEREGIYAEMFVRNPDGGKMIINGDGPAVHKVFVRFD